ncbi:MAG: hypothetical protein ACPG4N_04880 [Gammaproteobacteria bacterium]
MIERSPRGTGILTIHQRATNPEGVLSSLLADCIEVAGLLGQHRYLQWMQAESDGYGPDLPLPAYRIKPRVQLLAWMPGSHWMQAPVTDEAEQALAAFDIRDPITRVQNEFEAHKGKGGMRLDLSEEQQAELRAKANLNTRLALAMPSESYARIVASVRVMIQLWSKDLLNAGIVSCQRPDREALAVAAELDALFPDMARRIQELVDEMVSQTNQREGLFKRLFR